MLVTLLLGLLSGAAAYANLLAAPSSGAKPNSPFASAPSELVIHATGLDEAAIPSSLNVVASPRALPKPANGGSPSDPLGLWDSAKRPEGPRGPSVFKLNQGRAIDVLRSDYPRLFDRKPDLSIFTKDVQLHDPSGKRLSGLRQYDRVFDMLRFLRSSCMQDAEITYRLVVDHDEKIKVRWSTKLWMRDPALGLTSLLASGTPALVHLDGVSVYELDAEGKIDRHRLENIVMRGDEMKQPVQLAFAWPNAGFAQTPELALPFFRSLDAALPSSLRSLFEDVAQPQPQRSPMAHVSPPLSARPHARRAPPPVASASEERETPMQRATRERDEDEAKARALAEMRAPKPSQEGESSFLGLSMPEPCTTSYDCERPMVCCDLLFGSVCCTGGMMIPTVEGKAALQRQAIPIPVERDDGTGPGSPPFPGP